MKFIDEATIYIKAGDGGRGCVSFRREKYIPRGGPNGGDGGKGGNVVIQAASSRQTLLDMKYQQHHVAKRGEHGKGSNQTGRNSEDVRIVVPLGTLVKDRDTGDILADLTVDGQEYVAAKGGLGGRGNARFATSTNRAPRHAQGGIPGEESWITLELKLLADVGIIGLPNVGKSTFISKVSAARPKIADYPFTTLVPNLGVVQYGSHETLVIADIPGLIKGAHQGLGMGIEFLRHIERTAVLLHILDIADETRTSAWEDYETVNNELAQFNPRLREKPQIVAINKIDLPATQARIKKDIDIFEKRGVKITSFSALTGEGLKAVIGEIAIALKAAKPR